ncbi:hypothetical protein [Pseudorhodoplanes sinuspersici]|uniref:Uncharacterized protein n=1 Tax=Pseudorhodoplanes sinuspersici TaxID=1235591 RepID=A0A1W6ZX68_9HYPH|nr:hypothetical protein [Pseudorhodoplanes sinuspersici]ARQ01913.1 hypothetical protein CAK95_24545 [Pseudorhodoplanes sinuspersici]RKE73683.1 hypothetical protein DFP91_1578 [Pseudorhodoplanes sinuspersici]
MADVLNFDEVYAGDTSADGKRIVIVLKRGGEDVHITLPTVEVLRLLLAAIAAQSLAVEKTGKPLALTSSISFDKCSMDLFPDRGLARLTFELPGGALLPLQATIPNLRSLVTALSQALGVTPTSPESGSRH